MSNQENYNDKLPNCPVHQSYPIYHICINQKCQAESTFICPECQCQENYPHSDHRKDLIGVQEKNEFQSKLRQSGQLKSDEMFTMDCLTLQQFTDFLDIQNKNFKETINQKLEDFKQKMINQYKETLLTDQQNEQILNYQNTLVSFKEVNDIINKLHCKNNHDQLKTLGQQIKDIYSGNHIQQKQQQLQVQQYKKAYQDRIQDYALKVFDDYGKSIQKNIEELFDQVANFQTQFNIQKGTIQNFDDKIVQICNFKTINEFYPSPYKNTKNNVDLTKIKTEGVIKKQSDNTRIYSNSFDKNDLIIFKVKCPNIKSITNNKYFAFGVIEDQVKDQNNSWYFGSGSWVQMDGQDYNYSSNLSFSNNNHNLAGQIEDNSELIIVIHPQNSVFSILDTQSKLVIKNQKQFQNLDSNQKWSFNVHDYYCKNIILDNDIKKEDLIKVLEYQLF